MMNRKTKMDASDGDEQLRQQQAPNSPPEYDFDFSNQIIEPKLSTDTQHTRRNHVSSHVVDNHRRIVRLLGVDMVIHPSPTTISSDIIVDNNEENPNDDHDQVQEEVEQEAEEEVDPAQEFDPRRLIVEGVEEDPVMLFEKKLTMSDVASDQNRLLITKSDHWRLIGGLREDERAKILEDDYLIVMTKTAGRGRDEDKDYILHLRKWEGSGAIVLIHQWIQLVRANNLEQGDSVQGWGYRLHGQFRLALNIIKKLN